MLAKPARLAARRSMDITRTSLATCRCHPAHVCMHTYTSSRDDRAAIFQQQLGFLLFRYYYDGKSNRMVAKEMEIINSGSEGERRISIELKGTLEDNKNDAHLLCIQRYTM